MTQDLPRYIYKIVSAVHWNKAQTMEHLAPMPVDKADGYMHFSTAAQLAKTLEMYFSGQEAVAVLAIELAQFTNDIKWELSRGGELFPHLYAPLPMAAIAFVERLDIPAQGGCDLPPTIV